MSDISHLIVAKSDQLNAVDIIGGTKLITITSVDVPPKEGPIVVHYEGENGRPWKIGNKTVPRILKVLWGAESKKWVGQSLEVHFDPDVIYAGEAVGGIRPHAATGIDTTQIIKLKEKRGPKGKVFEIQPLKVQGGKSKPETVQFSMDAYEKAVVKIMSESKTADELTERWDRMIDWRKQAVQEDRDKATSLRESVEEKIASLPENNG
jgi:hypothetical protein